MNQGIRRISCVEFCKICTCGQFQYLVNVSHSSRSVSMRYFLARYQFAVFPRENLTFKFTGKVDHPSRPQSGSAICPGRSFVRIGQLLKSLTLNAMKSPLVSSFSIVRFFTGLLFGLIDPI